MCRATKDLQRSSDSQSVTRERVCLCDVGQITRKKNNEPAHRVLKRKDKWKHMQYHQCIKVGWLCEWAGERVWMSTAVMKISTVNGVAVLFGFSTKFGRCFKFGRVDGKVFLLVGYFSKPHQKEDFASEVWGNYFI